MPNTVQARLAPATTRCSSSPASGRTTDVSGKSAIPAMSSEWPTGCCNRLTADAVNVHGPFHAAQRLRALGEGGATLGGRLAAQTRQLEPDARSSGPTEPPERFVLVAEDGCVGLNQHAARAVGRVDNKLGHTGEDGGIDSKLEMAGRREEVITGCRVVGDSDAQSGRRGQRRRHVVGRDEESVRRGSNVRQAARTARSHVISARHDRECHALIVASGQRCCEERRADG
jgi:hypothetical protein